MESKVDSCPPCWVDEESKDPGRFAPRGAGQPIRSGLLKKIGQRRPSDQNVWDFPEPAHHTHQDPAVRYRRALGRKVWRSALRCCRDRWKRSETGSAARYAFDSTHELAPLLRRYRSGCSTGPVFQTLREPAARWRYRISRTFSGGRPIAARLPLTTIGLSRESNFCDGLDQLVVTRRLKAIFRIGRFFLADHVYNRTAQCFLDLFQGRFAGRIVQILDDFRLNPFVLQGVQASPGTLNSGGCDRSEWPWGFPRIS